MIDSIKKQTTNIKIQSTMAQLPSPAGTVSPVPAGLFYWRTVKEKIAKKMK